MADWTRKGQAEGWLDQAVACGSYNQVVASVCKPGVISLALVRWILSVVIP